MDRKRRGKSKIETHYGFRDIYRFYRNTVEDPLPVTTFSKLIDDFNTEICHLMIYKNFEFKFPGRLGTLRIRKRKIRVGLNKDGTLQKGMLRPDWEATKKLWEEDEESKQNKKLVYHLNRHSDGYNHRWFWDKTGSNVPNRSAYCLDMTRDNDRELAKAIKSGDPLIDYYE